MKKKSIAFMFLGVAALGLTACGDKGSETSNGPSTNPHVGENIPVKALTSILGSFTTKGSMVINYVDGYLPKIFDVYIAMSEEGLETYDYQYDQILQVLNVDGIQCYYVIDVDNTVKYAPYYDKSYNYVSYDFSLLSEHISSLRTTYFEMNEAGNYEVTNQAARNLIASTLAATYYDADDIGNVESMELVVENDKVTGLLFETVQTLMAVDSVTSANASVSYELEISNLGTTEIECRLEPYATYPEAKALSDAFDALGNNITVELSITVDNNADVVASGTAYLFDDLYYVSYSEESYSSAFGYVEYPGKNSLVGFTYSDGLFRAEDLYSGYTLKSAGLQFMASEVAPELFEYKNGKYVTRAYEDAQTLAPYVLVDFDGSTRYASEIVLTLDAEGNLDTIGYDVLFYKDSSKTEIEVHHYLLSFSANAEKVTDVEGLDGFMAGLTACAAANLDVNLIGKWDNYEYTVEIYYGSLIVNGEAAKLTKVSQTALEGTIDGTKYSISYVQGEENGVLYEYIELKVDDGETIALQYDVLHAFTKQLNVLDLASPGKLGLGFAMYDASQLSDYGMFYAYFEGEITDTTLEEYAELLETTTSYNLDITNEPATILGINSSESMGDLFGFDYVYINTSDWYTVVGLTLFEYLGTTYLVIWIWA